MSERQEHRQRLNARIAYAAAIERWAKNQPSRIRFFAVIRWLKEMPRKENFYAAKVAKYDGEAAKNKAIKSEHFIMEALIDDDKKKCSRAEKAGKQLGVAFYRGKIFAEEYMLRWLEDMMNEL